MSANSPRDQKATRGELLRIWGPVILLGLIAFGYTFTKLEPPAPRQLTIAAGSVDGAYYAFASAYREYLANQGFELRVLETAGSVENLRLLSSGEVDLALLQGGVAEADRYPDLESLASLFLEPLWVFYRADLEVERMTDLVGLRLAIGAEGSGTRVLVEDLLADNDFGEKTATLVPLSGGEAAEALERGTVDAAFFVASASASYVSKLLGTEGVEILSLRRYRAYQVRHPFLSPVILGEGVIDLDDNLPSRNVQMVAAAAMLGARRELHHAVVPLLLEALGAVHGAPDLFTEAGSFPSSRYVDLPLKPEAARYLANGPSFLYRILPHRTAAVVDRLKILLLPFIPLLLVVFKMAPPLYRWRIRSRIYRWYEDLRKLDDLLLAEPTPEMARQALETLEGLEKEIAEVTVPLSYMDEFYNLRMHLQLIEKKLGEVFSEARALRAAESAIKASAAAETNP